VGVCRVIRHAHAAAARERVCFLSKCRGACERAVLRLRAGRHKVTSVEVLLCVMVACMQVEELVIESARELDNILCGYVDKARLHAFMHTDIQASRAAAWNTLSPGGTRQAVRCDDRWPTRSWARTRQGLKVWNKAGSTARRLAVAPCSASSKFGLSSLSYVIL
jgi:hypothetical protein